MGYLNSFLVRESSSDLMPLYHHVNNPEKEISESYAAYTHLYNFIDYSDTDVLNVHIGDGSHCFTGAMFAMNTKSSNISIDPIINVGHVNKWVEEKGIKRFDFLPAKWEQVADAVFPKLARYRHKNLIFVHAHVNIKDVLGKIKDWDFVYTNPCCKFDTQTLDLDYQRVNGIRVLMAGKDNQIKSEKNMVFIYGNKIKGEA